MYPWKKWFWEHLGGKAWSTCTGKKMNNNTVSSGGLRIFSCFLLKELCWSCSCWMADVGLLGQGPPFPSWVPASCGACTDFPLNTWLHIRQGWCPLVLLAALSADAVINHRMTGWQCPSLTSGWLRRARFLPAWQRKAVSWEGLLALEMLLWNRCKTLHFQWLKFPFPSRSITKYFANQQAGTQGTCELWSSATLPFASPSRRCAGQWLNKQTASSACCMATRHQAIGEAVWKQRIFLEKELVLFWASLFAALRGIKNTVATIEFWYFSVLI